MIKCEGGKVELEEDANKLLSELTAICRGLRVFLVKEGYSKEKPMNLFLNQLRWGCGQTKKYKKNLTD